MERTQFARGLAEEARTCSRGKRWTSVRATSSAGNLLLFLVGEGSTPVLWEPTVVTTLVLLLSVFVATSVVAPC